MDGQVLCLRQCDLADLSPLYWSLPVLLFVAFLSNSGSRTPCEIREIFRGIPGKKNISNRVFCVFRLCDKRMCNLVSPGAAYVLEKSLLFLLRHSLTHGAEPFLRSCTIVQPLKNFPAFYGIRRFITVFTRALLWSLS
jgi:hypothetical protein